MITKEKNKFPLAEPVLLEKLVDYAPGAIVSREIAKNNSGTVTVFAFDEGQGLSEHTAPFDAIVQVLDGEGELVIDGKKVNTKTGETVIMPANIPHSVNANKPFKMQLIMLKDKKK
ncbi:cupin domain-containing protein [candidate division KSB1 bacterium]|nr:cupin domain-containing protein [candidate division KSB1 bacterium]